ncbi:MAG TPA: ester cyclase [Actinophytocola sp.]|uniref:ester cyclase n=1 Tax=Actinophytocola sp. TaxID=1872138 RepID=UPI002DBC8F73|nr:ester cyclase [Actinophytocola sp.]HEU5473481.1 ester cyclase [Actinophytocola sp.]
MSTDQGLVNKAVVRRLHDAVNTGDAGLISRTINEVVRGDAVLHIPAPVAASGARGVEQVMAGLLRAYPDLHLDVEDLIAEGDKVVGRTVVTGTHNGEYLGHAATGISVRYNEIFVFRLVDGRIAEIWGVADVLSQLKQIGVIAV